MAEARRLSPLWRAVAVLAFVGLLASLAVSAWWANGTWRPDRAAFPVQGVRVDPALAPVSWRGVATSGASFAYIDATRGAAAPAGDIAAALAGARAAGLKAGAIHRFAPCEPASEQAASFIRHVPRDRAALPVAVWLTHPDEDDAPGACRRPPSRAALLSELTTFLGQVEAHSGTSAIIAPSAAFERAYRATEAIDRPAWLRRDYFKPGYGREDWGLWQASDRARVPGTDAPVGWVVMAGETR